MVAAPDGTPALARAMRLHADGVRNMMQAELVPSFTHAIDRIMAKHVLALSDEIGGLKDGQHDLQAEFRSGLSGVQASVSDLAETLNDVQATVADHATQLAAHTVQLAAHDLRITRTEQAVRQLMEWRARLDEWRKQL